MTALFEEVNDTLQEVGQMVVADLSKDFSLPHDFLMQVITHMVQPVRVVRLPCS